MGRLLAHAISGTRTKGDLPIYNKNLWVFQSKPKARLKMSEPTFDRITIRQDQMGGVPCIRGLRIPVATVVGMVADGMTDAEILAAYPDLEPEDIRASLHFAAEAVAGTGTSACCRTHEAADRQCAIADGSGRPVAGGYEAVHVRRLDMAQSCR